MAAGTATATEEHDKVEPLLERREIGHIIIEKRIHRMANEREIAQKLTGHKFEMHNILGRFHYWYISKNTGEKVSLIKENGLRYVLYGQEDTDDSFWECCHGLKDGDEQPRFESFEEAEAYILNNLK